MVPGKRVCRQGHAALLHVAKDVPVRKTLRSMLRLRERTNRCRQIKRDHRLAAHWLQPTMAGDRRWIDRHEIELVAELRPRGGRRLETRVGDLSPLGCRIHGTCNLIVGSYSWITFPTLESWYARIAWCDGSAAGLDFAEPLHRAVTDMLVHRGPSGHQPYGS